MRRTELYKKQKSHDTKEKDMKVLIIEHFKFS